MIEVWTGGQAGVDQAAWRAAKAAGLPTGGWMPAGWATEGPGGKGTGCRFSSEWEYGARQLPEYWRGRSLADQYRERTRRNVEACGAVLLLTADSKSPGSRLTERLASEMGRNRLTIVVEDWRAPAHDLGRQFGNVVLALMAGCRMRGDRLMVAGTRESKAPGIGEWAEDFLTPVFREFVGADPEDLR